jgi:hypothetical protein
MTKRRKILLAAAIGLMAVAGTGYASAAAAQASASDLRATGLVGERANGYLGIVGEASADLRARVNAVNIKRRAAYTNLAGQRGVAVEQVGATMACELFATAVGPGQYYQLPDGIWRRREGNAPVQRPPYCV